MDFNSWSIMLSVLTVESEQLMKPWFMLSDSNFASTYVSVISHRY